MHSYCNCITKQVSTNLTKLYTRTTYKINSRLNVMSLDYSKFNSLSIIHLIIEYRRYQRTHERSDNQVSRNHIDDGSNVSRTFREPSLSENNIAN